MTQSNVQDPAPPASVQSPVAPVPEPAEASAPAAEASAPMAEPTAEALEPAAEPRVPLAPPRVEHDLVYGRPVEDRGFEMVETGAGFAVGLAVGAMVAGPIGAAVGGVAGAAGGFVAGEALERRIGRAATTTDAVDEDLESLEETSREPVDIA